MELECGARVYRKASSSLKRRIKWRHIQFPYLRLRLRLRRVFTILCNKVNFLTPFSRGSTYNINTQTHIHTLDIYTQKHTLTNAHTDTHACTHAHFRSLIRIL